MPDEAGTRKVIMAVAAVMAVVYGYFGLFISPLKDEIKDLKTELNSGQDKLKLLKTLKKEQERLSHIMNIARTEQTSFDAPSLLSKVEGIVKNLKLSDKAISLRPIPVAQTVKNAVEEKLEIRFVTLGFRNVLQFLDKIEALPTNVRIESLNIRKTGATATMTLIISSLLFGTGK